MDKHNVLAEIFKHPELMTIPAIPCPKCGEGLSFADILDMVSGGDEEARMKLFLATDEITAAVDEAMHG